MSTTKNNLDPHVVEAQQDHRRDHCVCCDPSLSQASVSQSSARSPTTRKTASYQQILTDKTPLSWIRRSKTLMMR